MVRSVQLLITLFLAITPTVFAGAWSSTASMLSTRHRHTATLLRDGRVLVTGGMVGFDGSSATSSAEIFDPATGTWSATGGMAFARSRHTATLLPDGRVLVAGGRATNGASLNSAEIYDPATGLFTVTGSMTDVRDNFSAVALSDGQVLVTGGLNLSAEGPVVSKTAEIYNPLSGVWRLTDHMANSRYVHSSTLMTDGRVIVSGGQPLGGDCVRYKTAEIFDPATERWTNLAPMNTARSVQAAILLADGKLLVAGGQTVPATTTGAFGICISKTASTEILDSNGKKWSETGSMGQPRNPTTNGVRLANGTVLVAGGTIVIGGAQTRTGVSELFDPLTGQWTYTGSLLGVRSSHVLTPLSDGRVLATGGLNLSGPLATAEIYVP